MQKSFILHASELSNLITVFKKLKSEPWDSQEHIAKGEKVLDYIQEHFELVPGEPRHKNLKKDNPQGPETYPNTKLPEEEELKADRESVKEIKYTPKADQLEEAFHRRARIKVENYLTSTSRTIPDPRSEKKEVEEEVDTVTSDMYELMVKLSLEAGSHRPVLEELVEYLKVNTSLQEQNNFVKELTKAIICYRGKEIERARIDFRRLEEEVKVLEESIEQLKQQ